MAIKKNARWHRHNQRRPEAQKAARNGKNVGGQH